MTTNLGALKANSKIENTRTKKLTELNLEPDIEYQTINVHKKQNQIETNATTNENNQNVEFGINSEQNLILTPHGETNRNRINDNVLVEKGGEKSSDSNNSNLIKKRLYTTYKVDEESDESNNTKKNLYNENTEVNNLVLTENKTIYQNESGDIVQEGSRCIICNKIYSISEMFTSVRCEHLICRKCLKRFFEEKIEEGTFDFKCPIFFCKYKYDLETLEFLVTKQHYNIVIGKKSQIQEMKDEIEMANNTSSARNCSMNYMKKYSKKFVEDIGTNEQFYYYNKCKYFFCQNCSEMALFSKSDTHFIKCLNCFYCICKYCLKKYEDGHMDLSKKEHCKVYYRTDSDDIEESSRKGGNLCCKCIDWILFAIIAYLALFCAAFCYLERFFFHIISCGVIKRKRKVMVILISYLLTIIVFICIFPILAVSLPYYPIFTSIFG